MPDERRRPTQAHASTGSSPTSTSGLYTQQARLNGMHGRRVPVDPPQPVVVESVWEPPTALGAHDSVDGRVQWTTVRCDGPGSAVCEVTAHSVRHWYCTKLERGGADLRTVQTLARHANLNTTTIYMLVTDESR